MLSIAHCLMPVRQHYEDQAAPWSCCSLRPAAGRLVGWQPDCLLVLLNGVPVLQYGETYDWRLSVPNMEKRDSYFTRLKWRIELTHHTQHEKVCPSNAAASRTCKSRISHGLNTVLPQCTALQTTDCRSNHGPDRELQIVSPALFAPPDSLQGRK